MAKISVQDRAAYEDLCKDYLNLKLLAHNACNVPERLERCKQMVRQDVHSSRKLSRVTEFEHLVVLLEQRNLVSLLKPEVFTRFERVLDSADFLRALERYRDILSSHYTAVRRFHLEGLRHRDRRTLLEKEVEKIKLHEALEPMKVPDPITTTTLCETFLQQRESIYTLLQHEIGKSWRMFGRFMNISPGTLDEIEERNRGDLKMRIFEVIESAERNYTNETLDQFVSLLQTALESSRRKDLKRRIQKMLECGTS